MEIRTLCRRYFSTKKDCFIIIILLLIALQIINITYTFSSSNAVGIKSHQISVMKKPVEKLQTRVILLYTGLFYKYEWTQVPYSEVNDYTKRHNCPVQNCNVTYDRTLVNTSDVLIFHCIDLQGPTQHSAKALRELAGKHKKSHQRWVFFCHEPPIFTWSYNTYDGLFNWSMTYMEESDIFLPYFNYEAVTPPSTPSRNFASQKSEIIAIVVSHCGLYREIYVKELQKHIPVHVYGACGTRYMHNKGILKGDMIATISKYKFYLAFENSNCTDYITEKYWRNSLGSGAVPIVMGTNYRPSTSIPGSFIDAANFKSPKDLAQYLHYLNKNDTAYNKYFAWKEKFKVNNGYDMVCQICKTLKERGSSEQILHVSKFWNSSRTCKQT